MNLQELKRLVEQGEGRNIEFKRKAADPVKIVKEVVAFANHKGGKLIVGVNDDGNITGLKHPMEEAYVLEEAIQKHCRPAIDYEFEYVTLNSKKKIVVFHILENPKKPVFLIYNFKRNLGKAYIRVADKSIQASREVRQILKARTKNQDSSFQYGDKEKFILQFLSENDQITKQHLVEQIGIEPQIASTTLVNLTISNVLELHPGDHFDYYTLKHV